ncbi:MAG: outer membrane protein assembly factor BamD [Gemmatimonadaceae bacterium]|nr:outer membrane protein assembly factor BamD [Gemmatimonadaceae bacterium]
MPPVSRNLVLVLAVVVAAACTSHPWNPKKFTSNEELYKESLRRFQRGKIDDAIAGFEQLTLDLPARDTLLSRSQYWLGQAHEKKGEHILAAQSFSHLMESFPDDTLADDALLLAGKSYRKLWRKSSLDATYGESALNTFNTLLALYPNSPLRGEAEKNIRQLETEFAKKDYDTGVHYLRRKAFDSAILYFKDVVKKYPRTDFSRQAQLRLVQAYDAISYRADRDDTCAALRENYPRDAEVRQRCGTPPVATTAPSAPPAP